jgi:hypothetical protein
MSDVKIEKFQQNLRCPLDDKGVAERADRAARLLASRDEQAEEQKAAAQHAKAKIAECEAELRRVSAEVRDRATYRLVECERRYVYRTGTVQEWRTDTNQLVDERAMSPAERQLELGKTKVTLETKPAAETKTATKPKAVKGPAKLEQVKPGDDGIVPDDYKPEGTVDGEPPPPKPLDGLRVKGQAKSKKPKAKPKPSKDAPVEVSP